MNHTCNLKANWPISIVLIKSQNLQITIVNSNPYRAYKTFRRLQTVSSNPIDTQKISCLGLYDKNIFPNS